MEIKYLSYEQFGAVGDGKSDDMEAIVACHNEANRTGAPIKTKDGATYYIGGKKLTAVIKTPVDFGTSKFIIDDRNVEDIRSYIFDIASDFESFTVDIKSLKKGQSKLDIPHKGNLYVRVISENKKMFIRKGLNMNSGASATDCFLLDESGNISPSVDWDHPQITSAYARCIDDKPLTINGGIFTTIANQAESFYNYHSRGFVVNRANVTIKNLTHYVEGELNHGAPYAGFIQIPYTANITVRDTVLTPHLIYLTQSKIPGKLVQMGSYDINIGNSINVHCENLTQTIDIRNGKYWGIYTSNFSKNLSLTNCTISRFDAHMGVTNLTIKSCRFGHQGMNLIGFGEAYIEDTEVNCYHFFRLRSDYGSIWDGNVTIKNCVWRPTYKTSDIFTAINEEDHDFGYKCTMPHKLTIDGFHVYDEIFEGAPLYILPVYNRKKENANPLYAYGETEELSLKNITAESKIPYEICEITGYYKNLKIN